MGSMPCTRETAQSSYRAGLRLLERINTRSRENVVDGAGLAGSNGGHSREARTRRPRARRRRALVTMGTEADYSSHSNS